MQANDSISREQAIKDCAEAFQLGEAYCDKQSIIGERREDDERP